MAFQSGLFYFHHDLEGSHDTDIQAHLCVEHTGILDVLGLQLDLLFINGRTGQLGQSLGNFLAGDLAVQAAGCAALGLDGHSLALDLGRPGNMTRKFYRRLACRKRCSLS